MADNVQLIKWPSGDKTAVILWWDALAEMLDQWSAPPNEEVDYWEWKIEKGLRMARESEHEDAKWLTSLFPSETAVSAEDFSDVMQSQGDDRARCCLSGW